MVCVHLRHRKWWQQSNVQWYKPWLGCLHALLCKAARHRYKGGACKLLWGRRALQVVIAFHYCKPLHNKLWRSHNAVMLIHSDPFLQQVFSPEHGGCSMPQQKTLRCILEYFQKNIWLFAFFHSQFWVSCVETATSRAENAYYYQIGKVLDDSC